METRTMDVDLSDPELFQKGDPFPVFARLRREAPVYWNAGGEEPFWAITRYEDVIHVSKNPEIFRSGEGTIIGTEPEGSMLSMDDPRHRQLRRLVERGFTARMVRGLEAHTREIARAILDEIGDRDEVDFVESVSCQLPLRVIAEMLGAPRSDAEYVRRLGDIMVGNSDPDYNPAGTEETPGQAQIDMFNYFRDLADERRKHPKEDLVSVLLDAEVEGEKLEEMDFLIFCMLLIVAGNETTRNLISGGMLHLFRSPDELRRLQADPSLMPTAVEEMLRCWCTVMHFKRTATQDTEIRGQTIRQGDRVVLWYIAANRDEDVFPDPERFDVGRDPNPHLTFGGGGPHFCLGASLARQEIRVMFEELLSRFPDIELAGEPERLRSNFIRGIKRMPVRLRP